MGHQAGAGAPSSAIFWERGRRRKRRSPPPPDGRGFSSPLLSPHPRGEDAEDEDAEEGKG